MIARNNRLLCLAGMLGLLLVNPPHTRGVTGGDAALGGIAAPTQWGAKIMDEIVRDPHAWDLKQRRAVEQTIGSLFPTCVGSES